MPRPKTKDELLSLSQSNFSKLLDYIDTLPEVKRNQAFPSDMLNNNIRDVLAHLHHWHLMMLEWYEIGMSGIKPEMPAKGYTWKTTSDLNKWINEKYSNHKFDDIKDNLNKSHNKVMQLVHDHSDEELFTKKLYKWTGSTSLGAYLISSTSSHYDWAFKLIKKVLK